MYFIPNLDAYFIAAIQKIDEKNLLKSDDNNLILIMQVIDFPIVDF